MGKMIFKILIDLVSTPFLKIIFSLPEKTSEIFINIILARHSGMLLAGIDGFKDMDSGSHFV